MSKYPYNKYKKTFTEYRRNLILNLKINGCSICGYNKCTDSLDFHHVNFKDKRFRISVAEIGHNYSYNEIFNELNKCVLVCANCHREIHYKERMI